MLTQNALVNAVLAHDVDLALRGLMFEFGLAQPVIGCRSDRYLRTSHHISCITTLTSGT